MVADPTNITSLFDIVIKADQATGGLLLYGILLGLNFALAVRYSNKRNGVAFAGLVTAFIAFGIDILFQVPLWPLISLGVLEAAVATFLVFKENIFDAS